MAKMHKGATEKYGREEGRKYGAQSPLTVAEREALTWDQRREQARTACKLYRETNDLSAISHYPDEFDGGFESGYHDGFYAPVKQLESKRKAWRDLLKGITHEQAMKIVADYVEAAKVRGARYDRNYARALEVRRNWDVQATLYMEFERADSDYIGMSNPDDNKQRAGRYDFDVKISWSGTSRGIEVAVANIALYQELTNLAAELKCLMSEHKVIWSCGIPEPEPEPAAAAPETSLETPAPVTE